MTNIVSIVPNDEEDQGEIEFTQNAYATAKAKYEKDGGDWSELSRREKLPLYQAALVAALTEEGA